ncbi:universal stress protein [Hyphomicrobium denitrificans]|uniref:universal stress protein n=1 Tax=Hyphomicrobium denitrificans TaxID=53399 RepID=UPI0009D9D484|nr:universal stress protein [Hyphomicrobium denitrificans]
MVEQIGLPPPRTLRHVNGGHRIFHHGAVDGIRLRSGIRKDQFPAEGIVSTAQKCGCDLIVTASHGHRGLMRLMLGSQAHRVVTQSTISVLICR